MDKPWAWTDIYPAFDVINHCKQGNMAACIQLVPIIVNIHVCHQGKTQP